MQEYQALAIIVDRETNKELYSFEFTCHFVSKYSSEDFMLSVAKEQALKIFEEKQKYQPNLKKYQNYFVDCVFI